MQTTSIPRSFVYPPPSPPIGNKNEDTPPPPIDGDNLQLTNPPLHEPTNFRKVSVPKPNNKSISSSPKSYPFSPTNAETKDNSMPTIDESVTKTKTQLGAKFSDEYSGDSMYSSEEEDDDDDDDDEDDLDDMKSMSGMDKAQQYRQFGPAIKLTNHDSARDQIRYSAVGRNRESLSHNKHKLNSLQSPNNKYVRRASQSSKYGLRSPGSTNQVPAVTYANITHHRNIGSIGSGFRLESGHNGYGSDNSDDSQVSVVSQSYGGYIFDENYKTRIGATSVRHRLGGLQFGIYIETLICTYSSLHNIYIYVYL